MSKVRENSAAYKAGAFQLPFPSGKGRGEGSIAEHLPLLMAAPNGIKKLRRLILELAVRGKLVLHDPHDEPASELLKRIQVDTARLIAEGWIKKDVQELDDSNDEAPYELPLSWKWVRLGAVLEMINGRAFKPSDWKASGLPIVRIQNLNNKDAPFNYCDETELDERHRIDAGDFLISWSGTPGTSFGAFIWTRGKAALNQHIFKCIKKGDAFVDRYLQLAINGRLDEMIAKAHGGVGLQHITKGKLEALMLALPPRAEQHRIVAKFDELMALCDRLEAQQGDAEAAHERLVKALLDTLTQSQDAADFAANWQRLSAHFDTLFTTEASIDALKQTLLQLAVMGKLVPPDPNDEPASALLKRIQAEKARLVREGKIREEKSLPVIEENDKPYELPHGWKWIRLGNMCELVTSGSRDWAKYYSNTGAIFVRMGNLSRGSFRLRLENIQYVTPPNDGEGTRTKLLEGDILVSITGDVGLLGLIPPGFGEAYINQHTALVRLISTVRNGFIPNFFLSPSAKEQFDAPQRGVKNSFRLTDILEMMVPLPPLAEQHRIVAKVDELMALCDTLKARLAESRALHERLATALVEQAVAA